MSNVKVGRPNYGAHKLVADQIKSARDAWVKGATILSLAGQLGVSDSTLWRAIHGETYKHLPYGN